MSFNQYYKSELAFIDELARGFAEANPATAALLKERGSDPDVDLARSLMPAIEAFLQQEVHDRADLSESWSRLHALVGSA